MKECYIDCMNITSSNIFFLKDFTINNIDKISKYILSNGNACCSLGWNTSEK